MFGGLVSVIVAYHKGPLGHDAPEVYWAPDPSQQAYRQVYGLIATLALSIVSGTITGFILNVLKTEGIEDFTDAEWWEIGENPYPSDEIKFIGDRIETVESALLSSNRRV